MILKVFKNNKTVFFSQTVWKLHHVVFVLFADQMWNLSILLFKKTWKKMCEILKEKKIDDDFFFVFV